MEEILIPIVLFAGIALIFWLFYMYRHRGRVETQKTIRLALEKGNELSPEFMQSLAEPEPPKNRDLRRGMIWMALAIGLALCGWAVPDPTGHAFRGCLAGAAFPFAIGFAYMIMWRYGANEAST